jgi:hypothetical protein
MLLHSPTPESSSHSSGTDLIDPTGVTKDFSSFNLNPQPQDLTLPDSPTKSLDSVTDNLCNQLFMVQLDSTEFQFARNQSHLYDVLLDAYQPTTVVTSSTLLLSNTPHLHHLVSQSLDLLSWLTTTQ